MKSNVPIFSKKLYFPKLFKILKEITFLKNAPNLKNILALEECSQIQIMFTLKITHFLKLFWKGNMFPFLEIVQNSKNAHVLIKGSCFWKMFVNFRKCSHFKFCFCISENVWNFQKTNWCFENCFGFQKLFMFPRIFGKS